MKEQMTGILLASLLAVPPGANADMGPTDFSAPQPSPNIFDLPINDLDPLAMESTRGGIAPLAIALGVAGVDLALMGFFWGVYLPYYAPSGPSSYTEAP